MHSTAPVLRSVTAVISPSPSKIPHLRFHIIQRRAQSVQRKQHGIKQPCDQRRRQSTIAHAAELVQDVAESPVLTGTMKHIESQNMTKDKPLEAAFASKRKMEQLLKYSNLYEILQDGIPDRILSALMSDAIGTSFLKSAPDHLFNKALLALTPEYFIDPYKDVFRWLQSAGGDTPLDSFRTIDERLSTMGAYLDRIVGVRRENGRKVDIEACRHLLRWAGSMGDASLARTLFDHVMPQDDVQADLQCYNYYCQALVWSNAYNSATKFGFRVLPSALELRGSGFPPKQYVGHQTANPVLGIKGVRQEVLDAFKDSMRTDEPANEMTFNNLMTAMGREADLDGVNSILRSVWNIDIHLLRTYDEEEIESPTYYEEGHHLRPSENLLFTVVHIFGSNNDVRTAWLLVDYISRNYNLSIPEFVWGHLLEWSYRLFYRDSGSQHERATGRISHDAFLQIYDTMADQLGSVRQNVIAHYFLVQSWKDRGKSHLSHAATNIRKVEDLVQKQHVDLKRTQSCIMQFVENATTSGLQNAFSTFEFYHLRRKFSIDFLALQTGLQLLNRAVDADLLRQKHWAETRKLTGWTRRNLPRFLKVFETWLPSILRYETKTGYVEIVGKNVRNAALFRRFNVDYKAITYLYNALDTEDQTKLNLRMKMLPSVIQSVPQYCFRCDTSAHSQTKCSQQLPDEIDINEAYGPEHDIGDSLYVLPRSKQDEANAILDPVQPDSTIRQSRSRRRHAPVLPFA